jgi:hypothetical protein
VAFLVAAGVPPPPKQTDKEMEMADERNVDERTEDKDTDLLVEPVTDDELEDVSGGCTNCANGCSLD